MRAVLIVVLVAISVSSCARNRNFRSPIDNVRDASYQLVSTYATDTNDYINKYGEKNAKEKSIDMVRNGLKDPDSAKFRDVRVVGYGSGKLFCGEVNAKNSYGGYVGFKMFAAGISGSLVQKEPSRYPAITDAENAGIFDACIGR